MSEPQGTKEIISHIRMRIGTADDVNFGFNSWLKSYRHSNFAREMQSEVYYDAHHRLIEGLFRTANVTVACSAEDPTQIYGYMCWEKQDGILVVHFAYVKEPFRGLGIGKLLLASAGHNDPAVPFCYTHQTKFSSKYAKRYPIVYHPYLAFHAFARANEAGNGE